MTVHNLSKSIIFNHVIEIWKLCQLIKRLDIDIKFHIKLSYQSRVSGTTDWSSGLVWPSLGGDEKTAGNVA
jgi:hypothetical protein